MSMVRRLHSWIRLVLDRGTVETDLDDEVRGFYQSMVDRYVGQGLTEQEARRLAHMKFSPPEQVKEAVRDARAGAMLASMLRDFHYALRTLRKRKVFTAVTILTLGLGIGANATIFSIVSRFILHAPPVRDPGSLLGIHTTHDGERCCNNFSWPLFADVREQSKSFLGLAAYYELVPASVGGASDPERVWGQAVTANFFDVAEVPLLLGRGFQTGEDNQAVIVLSERLWRRRFGADPAIEGKTIRISGRLFTVVGVTPAAFRGLDLILDCQFWVPLDNLDVLLPNTSNHSSRNYHWVTVIGRLRPGMTRAQADAELKILAQLLAKAHPESERGGGFLLDEAGSLPPRDKATLMLLFAALTIVALLVLAIACANVANLSLAQASGRQREMAVRLALGATRGHLLRQLITESLLLALSGGVLGVLLSMWATQGLRAFRLPAPVPLDLGVSVDWRVLLYTFALSAGAGLVFGLIPAWAAARPAIGSALKGDEPGGRPGRTWTVRNLLVMVQIAMSVVLLYATGLFLRSFQNAARVDIGFHSRGILMMSIDPRLHGYSPERTTQFLSHVREKAAALPGAVAAAATDMVPLSGGHRSDGFEAEGRAGKIANAEEYMVTPGFFETLGIALIAGRDFQEGAAGAKVAVVNEAFAQQLFGQESPLGRRVGGGGRSYEIIGLVKNIKSRTVGEDARPILYRALAQDIAGDPSFTGYSVVVRFTGDSQAVAEGLRREIHTLDPTLAIFNAETMEQHLRDALFLPRFTGTLFGIFGFIGLSLAAVGLYGVISYWVSRRTREIGIRLAIGARSGEVQRLFIREGMLLVLIAVIPGMAAAWVVARLFSSLLYGVPTHDPATLVAVPLFLAMVAVVACWIPSLGATKVDPSITLRHE